MSTKLVGWALRDAPHEYPDLSTGARLLLVYLADHFNEDEGAAWPSHKRLAGLMRCNDRSIRRWLDELVKAGIITTLPRAGTSSLYRFTGRAYSPNPNTKGRTQSPNGTGNKSKQIGRKGLQSSKEVINEIDEPNANPDLVKQMLDELRKQLRPTS